MRKLLDVNVWAALLFEGHVHHETARSWYGSQYIGPGDLLFCRQTEMSFLRLLTREAPMKACGWTVLTNREAIQFLNNVHQHEADGFIGETHGTRALWIEMSKIDQSSPNLWTDTYLAALAITQHVEVVSFDRGFEPYRQAGLNLTLLTKL